MKNPKLDQIKQRHRNRPKRSEPDLPDPPAEVDEIDHWHQFLYDHRFSRMKPPELLQMFFAKYIKTS